MILPAPTEIVLGPPGTGKTTTLVADAAEELGRGVEPDRIGYVAFTRRATHEVQDRMRQLHSLSRRDLPHFRTLHSLCMHWLGLRSGQVMDGQRLLEFGDLVGERITGRFSQDDGTYAGYDRGDRMLFMDNLARVRGITLRQQYEEAHDDIDWVVVERFSRALRQFKEQRGLVDYTDMLERFVQEGRGPRLEVLYVDEMQDLSSVQWRVVQILAQSCRRVVVAGDDDQSIYRWAGADLQTSLGLEGSTRVLSRSWRVPGSVQRAATSVIGRVRQRRPKEWRARDEEGLVSLLPDIADADLSGEWCDEMQPVLVLARNQYILTDAMQMLRSAGVLYSHHGHPSVRQSVLDSVVAWEWLRSGQVLPATECRRALSLMSAGAGVRRGHKTLPGVPDDTRLSLADLQRDHGVQTDRIWHEALDQIPASERVYMVRCRRQGERFSRPPRVRVDTIHASKGGEAHRVVLLTDMAQRTWQEAADDPDSESRVWYTGMTRARDELCIVRPRTHRHWSVLGD